VQQVGRRIAGAAVEAGAPLVAGVRGEGLLLGVHLHERRAAEVAATALEAGFIVNAVAPDTVRLAPPLILTAEQADSFLAALPGIVAASTVPPTERPQEP
jgi:acetylornithine aminotransferase